MGDREPVKTGDRGQGGVGQKMGDGRQETGGGGQKMGDGRQGAGDRRWGMGDRRHGFGDERQLNLLLFSFHFIKVKITALNHQRIIVLIVWYTMNE